MAFNFEMRATKPFLAWACVVAHQLEHQHNYLEFVEVVGLNPAFSSFPFLFQVSSIISYTSVFLWYLAQAFTALYL